MLRPQLVKYVLLLAVVCLAFPTVARGQCGAFVNPPPGPLGVSVNQGDRFTNDPDVLLYPVWSPVVVTPSPDPDPPVTGVDRLIISNDGGFQPSVTVPPASPIAWTLDSSGPERLPKTVYIRFHRCGNKPTTVQASGPDEQYQDDIILDETRPTIESAELSGGAQAAMASVTAITAGGGHRLRLKASDRTSGVEEMLITHTKKSRGKWRPFKASVSVGGGAVYVRVRDGAGNASRPRLAQ